LTGAAIATFNSETAAVQTSRLPGRQVEMNHDVDQPRHSAFQALGTPGRGKGPAHRQRRHHGVLPDWNV